MSGDSLDFVWAEVAPMVLVVDDDGRGAVPKFVGHVGPFSESA